MIGHSLFRGASTSDQLFGIVPLRGTPTREQIEAMNLSCPMQLPFHNVKPTPLIRVFGSSANPEAMGLLDRALQYSPTDWLRPPPASLPACPHPQITFNSLLKFTVAPCNKDNPNKLRGLRICGCDLGCQWYCSASVLFGLYCPQPPE